MKPADIEKRIHAIEAKLDRLTADRPQDGVPKLTPVEVLDSIHGTFENDSAFRQAMRLGRQWRKAQDKKPRPKRKSSSK